MSYAIPATPIPDLPTNDRVVTLDCLVTHEEWERDWSQREERYELVDGHPTMTPQVHPRNLNAASRLVVRFLTELGLDWRCLQGAGVMIAPDPRAIVRAPDLTLLHPNADLDPPLHPDGILLVAEVLSPSTRAVDLGRKRADYAGVGIPHYLIIDRHASLPTLTHLTDPVAGDYTDEVRGETITLHLAGHDITIHVADLIR